MKILQINNVYDFGSTGKITRDIHRGLSDRGYESIVCYGRRYKTEDLRVYKVCSELYGKMQNGLYQLTGMKYGGCLLSTKRIIKMITVEKPDIVHLHCLNGHFVNIYRLLDYLKKNCIPTVLTLHAEFMYTGGCAYAYECDQWKSRQGCGQKKCPLYKSELLSMTGDKSAKMWTKMRCSFQKFDTIVVVSVSSWLMERAKESPILSEKRHTVIQNGLDPEVFHRMSVKEQIEKRKELGLSLQDKVVFHATPSFDDNPQNIKGGYYVLRLAERMKDVTFIVAGKYDHSLSVPSNVKLLGSITDKSLLATLYSLADLTLITSRRETFSMVVAESLCCGTPVVGFRAGAPEMIAIPQYSDFCEYGDIDDMMKLLSKWLHTTKDDSISAKAIEKYNKNRMVDEYIKVYQSLIEKPIR